MLVENLVFAGQEGVDHVGRQLVQGDYLAFFLGGKFGDDITPYVQNPGGQGGIEVGEIFLVAQVPGPGKREAEEDAAEDGGEYDKQD